MRNPLTDTPDWRYGTALAEIEREAVGLPVYEPCVDTLVKSLKMVLPLRSTDKRFVDPDKRLSCEWAKGIELTLRIFEDQSIGGLRDTMEAALLAPDRTDSFFKEQVSRKLTSPTIALYRELFYDIQDQTDLKFWVHRNLFVPNRSLTNDAKLDTAYMWKVIAYHGGIRYLTQYAIDGFGLEDELRAWLRRMGVSEYVKQVLKSSHSYAKLLDRAGTPALPAAGTWDKQDNEPDRSDDDRLVEAGAAIAGAIVRPNESLVAEKQYMMSHKFEDKDTDDALQ